MIYIVMALIISFFAATFAIQNASPVWVKILYFEFETSLVLVILGSMCLGFLVALLFTMYFKIRAFWQIRKQEQKMQELQAKIQLLEAQLPSPIEQQPQENPKN